MRTYYAKAIHEMDPNVKLDEPAAIAAAMLMAGVKHGAVEDVVIQKAGLPREQALEIAARLRAGGVWDGLKTVHSGWDDPESGDIAFWMDAMVGTGMLQRAKPKRKLKSHKYGAPL